MGIGNSNVDEMIAERGDEIEEVEDSIGEKKIKRISPIVIRNIGIDKEVDRANKVIAPVNEIVIPAS